MNLNEFEFKLGRLPADIETMLCVIVEDIKTSRAALHYDGEGKKPLPIIPGLKTVRERRFILCCFKSVDVNEAVIARYVHLMEDYAAKVADTHDAYIRAAFDIYGELRIESWVQKSKTLAAELKPHKCVVPGAERHEDNRVSNGKKNVRYGHKR